MTYKHIVRDGRAISLDDEAKPIGERVDFGTVVIEEIGGVWRPRIIGLDLDWPFASSPVEAVKALEQSLSIRPKMGSISAVSSKLKASLK